MRSTLLIVLAACLMGAVLAMVLGPPQEPEDEELVSEQPLVEP